MSHVKNPQLAEILLFTHPKLLFRPALVTSLSRVFINTVTGYELPLNTSWSIVLLSCLTLPSLPWLCTYLSFTFPSIAFDECIFLPWD